MQAVDEEVQAIPKPVVEPVPIALPPLVEDPIHWQVIPPLHLLTHTSTNITPTRNSKKTQAYYAYTISKSAAQISLHISHPVHLPGCRSWLVEEEVRRWESDGSWIQRSISTVVVF
ncbi:hypothetical protein EI94DRAFT_1699682 [Lactarius quietus]|nr:hypothetical protein EI94DRAFT_1699682 [Lactarius quietus]